MHKATGSGGWRGKVVVITGASSDLGRPAAIRFTERGANVIVAARGEAGLRETVRWCQARGGVAQLCVADVCVEADLRELARVALEHSRRIDVWVNNAGVTAFGPLEMESFADHRRVIEVNLFGAVLGARVVLPVFRRQGHGVLINVGSVLCKGLAAHALAPRTTERLLHNALATWHFAEATQATGHGNLYQPRGGLGSISGGRPPRLSTSRLLLWVALRLLRLQATNAKAWAYRLVDQGPRSGAG